MKFVERFACCRRPIVRGIKRHLPLFHFLLGCFVEIRQRRVDRRVHALVDLVDLWVVGDRFERDMRHRLVDEAALQSFVRVAQCVVVIAGGHQALLGERDRHTRGVAGDPAAAPFLGNDRSSAGSASRIQYEVAGVSGHKNAAFDSPLRCLYNVYLCFAESALSGIVPNIVARLKREIIQVAYVTKRFTTSSQATSLRNPGKSSQVSTEGSLPRTKLATSKFETANIAFLWRPSACYRIRPKNFCAGRQRLQSKDFFVS